ncbi:glycerol-3-phosphate 1-O-acyltransferase PlsY [Alphaproteobacteria bacterium]|nr:glycerol-3-phosphate 1-O-acyltransferase PlsY [Alphaproteobacteria bacterium]
MLLVTNFLLIIVFYLIGSIPFALILTKLLGYGDIRNIGSGNVGATNVLRTGNKYLAFGVLCLDILKGFAPFIILNSFFDINIFHLLFLCHFAIVGHIFPIWLKFKGGKGVATYIGFLFGFNFFIGLTFLVTWITIALISKYSSLSSLVASLVVPLYFFYINSDNFVVIFLIYLFLLISLKHRENIKRLISGAENKIKLFK